MLLQIKSPSYFNKYYEVDAEVQEVCGYLSRMLESENYGDLVKSLIIVPVVAPYELINEGKWKEEVMFTKISGLASVFKHIDYIKYMQGSVVDRVELTLECVIEAGKLVKKKKGTKFNAKKFEEDIDTLRNNIFDRDKVLVKQLNHSFTMRMNGVEYNHNITKGQIKDIILFKLQEAFSRGNFEFLTLVDNEDDSFIQTTKEKEGYTLEVKYYQTKTRQACYVREVVSKEEIVKVFNDFFDLKDIDVSKYQDISNELVMNQQS